MILCLSDAFFIFLGCKSEGTVSDKLKSTSSFAFYGCGNLLKQSRVQAVKQNKKDRAINGKRFQISFTLSRLSYLLSK